MIEQVADIAKLAGAKLLEYFGSDLAVEHKTRREPVTVADKQSEKLIINALRDLYPEAAFLAEESGETGNNSAEFKWIIDPLDGTVNFAHGMPWFAVSIGLEKQGNLEMGVIHNPCLAETFTAVRSQGAFLNGSRINVSMIQSIEDAMIGTGFYYHSGDVLHREVKIFERVQDRSHAVRRAGVASLDLAHLAMGRLDAFWERGLRPWDLAAGCLLITEAGGMLSNYHGAAHSIYEDETLGSNRLLHKDIQKIVTEE